MLAAREGLKIILAIHPERSSLQNTVTSDTASGPHNCPEVGRPGIMVPLVHMTTLRSPRLSVWPEAAQEVAKPLHTGPSHRACHCVLPRTIFIK